MGVQPNGGADLVRQAIADVRALARGLHPAALTDAGLAAALRALPAPPGRSIRIAAPDNRFRAELETGVYYACVEAIQNASRHGRSDIDVSLRVVNGRLEFRVHDDGPAVDSGNSGGTESIRARLIDLDGEATVVHGEHGTTVSGWAPVC